MDEALKKTENLNPKKSILCVLILIKENRIKINSSYGDVEEIVCDILQGSTLGPLPVNIYIICDLFCEREGLDIANYTVDSPPLALLSKLQNFSNT